MRQCYVIFSAHKLTKPYTKLYLLTMRKKRLDMYIFRVFIILTKGRSLGFASAVDNVLTSFKQYGKGLEFTSELPESKHLQLLSLSIEFSKDRVSWGYSPRPKKEKAKKKKHKTVLLFDSSCSNLTQRGIASPCLDSSLRKSCIHKIQSSFDNHPVRMASSGFPGSLVTGVPLNASCEKSRKRLLVLQLRSLVRRLTGGCVLSAQAGP